MILNFNQILESSLNVSITLNAKDLQDASSYTISFTLEDSEESTTDEPTSNVSQSIAKRIS
jgi:hypothetical protein